MVSAAVPGEHADYTQLQQLVTGLSDGVILVTPNQRIAWANRAALDMHGITRQEELGATVHDYRVRFELRYRDRRRLPRGGHPMERLMSGQDFAEVVVEVAPAGSPKPGWTHRIHSMVLTDAAGQPVCLAVILNDETERFDAEERFERAFAANPAPALILRLADLRYIRVNRGFLEMTGYAEADVVGRSIHELDVLEGAKRRELALARLREHGTISQMEAWPRRAGGEPMLVLLAGQPIEVGNTPCILFTFADLEPRRRAEMSLYESEQRFERAFRLAPVPMALAALDDWFRFILVNDAFEEATGHQGADVVGRTAKELGLWVDPGAAAELERGLRDQHRVRGADVRLKARDGLVLDCVLSAEAVTIDGRSCALWVLHDVTERRRTEAELAAAIDAVMRDTSWFSQSVLEKLARLRTPAWSDNVAGSVTELTHRGREVLGLVSQGLDDVGIAERLGLSRTTVRNHVNDLYRRTGTHGRAALVVWARERGFARAEGRSAKRLRHPRR